MATEQQTQLNGCPLLGQNEGFTLPHLFYQSPEGVGWTSSLITVIFWTPQGVQTAQFTGVHWTLLDLLEKIITQQKN